MKSVCEKKKQNALVTIVVGSPTSGCAVDRLCTFWRRSYGGWKAAVPRKQCLQSAGATQRGGRANGSTRLVSRGCIQGWTVSEHIRRNLAFALKATIRYPLWRPYHTYMAKDLGYGFNRSCRTGLRTVTKACTVEPQFFGMVKAGFFYQNWKNSMRKKLPEFKNSSQF